MPNNQTIDTQILLDFTLDVLGGKVQPVRKEQEIRGAFDEKGFRVYNTRTLNNHFLSKNYLEKEILIYFYESTNFNSGVMDVLSQLALEMRRKNLNNF